MKPGFLSDKTIAIIGLGLMGGSLALALRGRGARIIACEKDAQTTNLARKNNIVDQITNQPESILWQAELIILATPVSAILDIIPRLPGWHDGSPLVMDIGSTKVDICAALGQLPARFRAVGGHPMCGKELSSLQHADKGLFQGAGFALCALPSTQSADRQWVEAIVTAIGAQPVWIDPLLHDQYVAATSHVPYLVANALAAVVPEEAHPLVGPGLRSTTRIAASSPEMMADIFQTNRAAVIAQLTTYQSQLEQLKDLLLPGREDELLTMLARGRQHYQRVISEGAEE